jgi:hypothetical protein
MMTLIDGLDQSPMTVGKCEICDVAQAICSDWQVPLTFLLSFLSRPDDEAVPLSGDLFKLSRCSAQ